MPSQTNLHFTKNMHFSGERQVGFWKSDNVMDPHGAKMEGMSRIPGSIPSGSSPLEKLITVGPQTVKSFEVPDNYLMRDENVNLSSQLNAIGADKAPIRSNFWTRMDHGSWTGPDFNVQPASIMKEGDTHYENGLFSSSMSDLFSRKLRLTSNNMIYGHSVDTVASQYEEEPFESLEEVEAQTIGNLLPNDDDLFSGVADGLEPIVRPSEADDIEDPDLFSIVGGMDLGDDDASRAELKGNTADVGASGEHLSRTLFVRNVDSNVEDSELQAIFEQYGDIRTLYTACKQKGFVIMSYYDIRAAQNAVKALQSQPLRCMKLDIHYYIPKDSPSEKDVNQGKLRVFILDSSVSNDTLHQVFGVYGEIKEICETPQRSNHKFIEFYDVRAAEAALCAVNRGEIAGNMIKVEPSHRGGQRQSSQKLPPELEQDKFSLYMQQDSLGSDSTAGFSGSLLQSPFASSSLGSEPNLATHAGTRTIIGPFIENAFCHGVSSSVPRGLSSLLRAESARNHSFLSESACSHSQMKHGFGSIRTLHPHSLPEYHDGLANAAPCNAPGNILGSIGSLPLERVESSHLDRMSINGHSVEISSGFCSSGNGNGSLPGHHFMWSNSNHPQTQPPSIMWPNSPSFANGIHHAHPASRLHGLPRAPSNMLNSALPVSSHHVGSAPVVNPSFWERQNAYPVGSPEASGFHQGPLGTIRLSGSPLHNMDFIPRSLFPHVGGNGMDLPIPSRNVGLYSHHQRSMVYPSRSQMHHMSSSFDPSNDRLRGRRGNSSSAQLDNKKQYELNIDRILRGEDDRTTLMIKNIPNKYTSKMLMAAIDERHRGTYDFIYLPIDFKNKCNVGYAFINMIDPKHIVPFYESFNGKKWEKFNSEKVASLAYARIQGKTALIAHFQNSSLMNEDKRCRPILFHTDGPNAGDQVPFPMGLNFRSRPGRPRINASEDNQQGSPPSSANKEESLNEDTSSGSGKDSE